MKIQKIKVEFEVTLPVEATLQEAIEWAEYNVNARASLNLSNPLADYELRLNENDDWETVHIESI